MGIILGHKSVTGSLVSGISNTEECVEFCMKNNIYPDCHMIEASQITWAYDQLSQSNKDGKRYVIDIAKSKANKDFMPEGTVQA